MAIDLAPMPPRVRVVTLHQDLARASALRRSLDASGPLPVRLEHHPVAPWTAESDEAVVAGRVDLVLLVAAPIERLAGSFLLDALARFSADATVAAVGVALANDSESDASLMPRGDVLLVRVDALRLVGGLSHRPPGPLFHVDLCVRLWTAGFRTHSVGAAVDDPQPVAWSDLLRRELTEVLALVLDDDDVAEPVWREPSGRAALAAVAVPRTRMHPLRQRGSGELVPMLHTWVRRWVEAGGPEEAIALLDQLGAPERAGARRRILVVTMDVLAPAMAGPAIRATAIATALAREHDVRLVTTARCEMRRPDFEVRGVSDADLEALVGWADVIVLQGWVMVGRPWLGAAPVAVVVDAYDPMHLEQLEQGREAGGARGRVDAVRGATATLNQQLRRADLVLCASDKQRDLWLGALAALGRVNPITYDDDPSLERLVTVVPFGVPDEPFPTVPSAIKGVVAGIGPDDQVILWGGGVYNWFDPLTLVRAVDRLRARVPTARLYFMGLVHPNPGVPSMRMASDLRALSDELGLTGLHVFFNDGWVPFDDRAGYLRDADVGVSTHLDHVETAFSFRTRILDYLWAGLPVVATRGDSFAPLIEQRGAGRTVEALDVGGLEAALADVLLDPVLAADARAASLGLAAEMTWAQNLGPLLDFCRSARRAADIACPTLLADPVGAEVEVGWRRDVTAAWVYLRDGGPQALMGRATGRIRRRWDERRRR